MLDHNFDMSDYDSVYELVKSNSKLSTPANVSYLFCNRELDSDTIQVVINWLLRHLNSLLTVKVKLRCWGKTYFITHHGNGTVTLLLPPRLLRLDQFYQLYFCIHVALQIADPTTPIDGRFARVERELCWNLFGLRLHTFISRKGEYVLFSISMADGTMLCDGRGRTRYP